MERGGAAQLKHLALAVDGFVAQLQCAICLCAYANPVSLPCNHCFCEECIHRALELKSVCPICKTPAKKRKLRYDTMIQQLLRATEMLNAPAKRGPVDIKEDEDDEDVLLLEEKPAASLSSSSSNETRPSSPPPTVAVAEPRRSVESSTSPKPSQSAAHKQNGYAHSEVEPFAGEVPKRRASGATEAKFTGSMPNGPRNRGASQAAAATRVRVNAPHSVTETTEDVDKQKPAVPPAQSHVNGVNAQIPVASQSVHVPLNGPFVKGQLVEVESRTWIGINKPGGTARITKVNGDGTYAVKYVLEPRSKSNVHDAFIRKASDEVVSTDVTPSRAVKQRQRRSAKHSVETPPSEEKAIVSAKKDKAVAGNKRKRSGMVFLCSGYDEKAMREIEKWSECLDAKIVSHWSNQVTHLIVKCVVGTNKLNGSVDEENNLRSTEASASAPPRPGTPGKRQLFGDANPIKRWVKIRSMKYLKALVGGRWIVSEEWLQACSAQGSYVSEVDFEADGHLKGRNIDDAVRRSRKRRQEILQMCPATVDPASVGTQLFEDFCFHLVGDFLPPMPPQLELNTLLCIGGGTPIRGLQDIASEMAKSENAKRQLVIVCDRINPVALRDTSKKLRSLPQLREFPDVPIMNYQWVLNSISEAMLRPLK
uniref:RING-type E3 ubiquitin transferase BRCA1 n=1 Tax=Globisporangium ultimum (strain ATCC 200006 / CBS 805.95 / DAOM BR144) TaxID=431595 RepID=K3X188_GLOUD